MKTTEIINAEELYFIDLETVGGMGICQIGITKWSKKENRLSIVFNETVNPDVPSEAINMHAVRVHRISEYAWSKANPYPAFHEKIKKLLDGKIVFQWGGNDIAIIYKNIRRYNLSEIKTTSLNSWAYQYKGMKLTDAAQKLEFSYNSLHSAPLDSYLAALLFVTDLCGYKATNIDMKIIDSFNSRSPKTVEKFNPSQLKTNGHGDEVCLTGFTDQEKKKFGEFLAEKGFKVRGNVTTNLRILITPSGSYTRSPAKEAEAIRVGARIMDFNTLIHRLA
jgi:DNA polymerase III alpha subunit (gram-positive type)